MTFALKALAALTMVAAAEANLVMTKVGAKIETYHTYVQQYTSLQHDSGCIDSV